MRLYHGSNVMIDRIDFTKSHPFKDFGCGFYLTDNPKHARNRLLGGLNASAAVNVCRSSNLISRRLSII